MLIFPSCQSSNVVVTEEVFTRKGRAYYSFLGTIWMIGSMILFFSFEAFVEGILVTLAGRVMLNIFAS